MCACENLKFVGMSKELKAPPGTRMATSSWSCERKILFNCARHGNFYFSSLKRY